MKRLAELTSLRLGMVCSSSWKSSYIMICWRRRGWRVTGQCFSKLWPASPRSSIFRLMTIVRELSKLLFWSLQGEGQMFFFCHRNIWFDCNFWRHHVKRLFVERQGFLLRPCLLVCFARYQVTTTNCFSEEKITPEKPKIWNLKIDGNGNDAYFLFLRGSFFRFSAVRFLRSWGTTTWTCQCCRFPVWKQCEVGTDGSWDCFFFFVPFCEEDLDLTKCHLDVWDAYISISID